jgi:hypothetical protein
MDVIESIIMEHLPAAAFENSPKPRRGHVVHQLDEDGHVVIALTGEPLHLGVDPGSNVELFGTKVHGESVPCPLDERNRIPVGSVTEVFGPLWLARK